MLRASVEGKVVEGASTLYGGQLLMLSLSFIAASPYSSIVDEAFKCAHSARLVDDVVQRMSANVIFAGTTPTVCGCHLAACGEG